MSLLSFRPRNKDIDYELELRVLRALSAGGGHRNVVSLEAEMEIVPVKVVGMAMRVSQVKREKGAQSTFANDAKNLGHYSRLVLGSLA